MLVRRVHAFQGAAGGTGEGVSRRGSSGTTTVPAAGLQRPAARLDQPVCRRRAPPRLPEDAVRAQLRDRGIERHPEVRAIAAGLGQQQPTLDRAASMLVVSCSRSASAASRPLARSRASAPPIASRQLSKRAAERGAKPLVGIRHLIFTPSPVQPADTFPQPQSPCACPLIVGVCDGAFVASRAYRGWRERPRCEGALRQGVVTAAAGR